MNRKMKYSMWCWLLAAVVLLNLNLSQIEARKLMLRPLNAREVYRILRDVGREDAVPEGRIVSQGIAAFTGFTLGLTKGIGGSILFDIITANVTGLLGTGTPTSTSNSSSTTQEICFNTRNARSLADAEAVARHYRQSDEPPTAARIGRSASGRRYEYIDDIADYNDVADYSNDYDSEYDDGLMSRASTGTSTAGTGTGTSTGGSNSGTVTSSNDSTTSNDKPATTCIVIQK